MNSGVQFIDNDIRDRLMALGRLLIDQTRARTIIPPKQPSAGFWFGGGNLVRGADGALYLAGRYRNYGDSRTGLGAGERGLELAIFRSEDGCRTFEKVLAFDKSDLDMGARTVLSIEGSALEFTGEGVRLLVSSEKAGIPYPAHLADYHKPGTGVWTIEEMVAPAIDGLKNAPRRTLFASDVPEHLHVKDPFFMPSVHGRRRVGFCTHPFNWSSSNTCFAEQAEDGQWHMAYEAFPRGAAWDVAMTRATCLVQIPPMGVFKDRALQLLFYDGGECLRPLDAHKNAVLRPRGYSCEELGGLALVTSQNPFSAVRVSRFEALFTSPYGTGCSRYIDVLMEKDWAYATWQQGQNDGSQPLMMHAVPMAEIEKILS